MMRRAVNKVAFIIVLLSLFAETRALINIPEDYPLIQQGIDIAVPGDTILIWPGTYIEELEINQKDLTLGSRYLITGDTSYISNTVLDGDSTYHILTCNGPHEINVSGLTFTHGYGDWILEPSTAWGGAVTANEYTDIEFNRCRFYENYGVRNTCINANDSCSVSIRRSDFVRNRGFPKTNVIMNRVGRELTIQGCSFVNNETRFWTLVGASSCKLAFVDSCIFSSNHGSYGESTSGMLLHCFAQRIEVTNCDFINHTFITGGRSLIQLIQADTLIMSDCLIDSNTISFGHHNQLVDLSGGNDHLFLNNIRISNNYSTDGDGFGIGLRAHGSQSTTADSIFITNNHVEYRHDQDASSGLLISSSGVCSLSNIYVMNNSALRSDLDEYPDVYSWAHFKTGCGGEVITIDHMVASDNLNNFSQVGLALSIAHSSPDQTVYLNDILIHDNTRLYTTPGDEWDPGGSGITIEFNYPFMRKVEINNLRLYNQYHTVYGAGIYAPADTFIIRNSHISDCGNNAITISSDYFEMENVLVNDCWNDRGEASSHIISGRTTQGATVRNCTIIDSYGDFGKAFYFGANNTTDEINVLVENCIIENTCPTGDALGYWEDANIDLTVRYSNIDGGWEGVGNIDLDPLFTDPENDDYTFLPESPCIDAGNPDPTYNDPEDPNHTGWTLWPSQGTLRNDMGCYGGPGAIELWDYQDVPNVGARSPRSPQTITLSQNYPNPFNPSTTIEFTLPYPQDVQLMVYNILGQKVAVLAEGIHASGIHRVTFNTNLQPVGARSSRPLSSGVYIYRLSTDDDIVSHKMMLIR